MTSRRPGAVIVVRLLAVLALALVALFHVLRIIAAPCSGIGCDVFIPLSLLLPLLTLVTIVTTGVLATYQARSGSAIWVVLLGTCTVVGGLGPLATLLVFGNSPDVLVPLATTFELLVPVAAVGHSAMTGRTGQTAHQRRRE